MNIYLR